MAKIKKLLAIFSLLVFLFGLPILVYNAANRAAKIAASAKDQRPPLLFLWPAKLEVNQKETFSVSIKINPRGKKVMEREIFLTFDPKAITYLRCEPEHPETSAKEANEKGEIKLTFNQNIEGETKVAEILFVAGKAGKTTLDFQSGTKQKFVTIPASITVI